MNPLEFEDLVLTYFKNNGYSVEKTPLSYDYGVDLFAFRGNNKVAIQVKMYQSRKVNHEAVMVLFAAQKYFDCDRSIIITTGELTEHAIKVAEKLGVEVWSNWKPTLRKSTQSDSQHCDIFFNYLWQNYIMDLTGKTIKKGNRENKIIEVTWDYLKRITSNGKTQRISIEIFRKVINHLVVYGEIERDKINELYVKRASSGIVLILKQTPYIELVEKPKIKLVLNTQMYDELINKRGVV